MSFALTSQDFPLLRFSREETEWLVELSDSPAFILKFVGSTAEYIHMNPLECSKEAALAFHFDISVLNNGPKLVTGRPTQSYAVLSSLSGRRALSIDSASSIDFESITTESDTQNSVDQLLKKVGPSRIHNAGSESFAIIDLKNSRRDAKNHRDDASPEMTTTDVNANGNTTNTTADSAV
ncbi:hypothetical protein N7489_005093 [Penicillium chrysogenum]|uniref:uncharacterized protein n=1 Tax=Penicillium chrysogenum TaxID=5076 RepID=UPI0024DF247B|nr:uncharacterized protein N7489_005093 [Penicillium chrysogenum]KAJ5244997.1 hypothetical protein N7489_005093 [Penicillium chrysogenum]